MTKTYCTSCGKKIDLNGKYCENCGAKIGQAGEDISTSGNSLNKKTSNMKAVILYVLLPVMLVCGFILGYLYPDVNGQKPAVKESQKAQYRKEPTPQNENENAAIVNGEPIKRESVVRELERQGGKQALDAFITKTLILQEAKKNNITIEQEVLDAGLDETSKTLERQGQTLDQVLKTQGMTLDQLRDQIRFQKMIEKLIGNIAVSDKEIDEYIAKNKASLPVDLSGNELRDKAVKDLQASKLNIKSQEYLTNLRKQADIQILGNYK